MIVYIIQMFTINHNSDDTLMVHFFDIYSDIPHSYHSLLQRGVAQEFDFDSDPEEEGNDADDFDGGVDSDSDSDEDGPITAANMEKKSRRLDAMALDDEEKDLGKNQKSTRSKMNEGDEDLYTFDLPTVEEREAEKKSGGAELYEVQRRIQDCVRVLTDFDTLAAKDRYADTYIYKPSPSHCFRSRTEYIEQLILDISAYYGYNEFLAEKLFQLFNVSEVYRIVLLSFRHHL